MYERCENALKARYKLCKLRTFWPISNVRIFCQNKNSLELLNIIFENSSPKGSFGANKKKVEFLLLSPDSWKLLTTSLYDLHQCVLGFKSNISARVLTKSWFQILNSMRSRRASLEFMMVGSNSYIPASKFTNSQFLILIEVAYRKMEKTFEF